MPSLKNPKADLRNSYRKSFEISLIVSLAVLIAAFKFSPQYSTAEQLKDEAPELISVEDITNTVQKRKIPPPPKAPKPVDPTSNEDIVEDFILDDIDEVEPVPLPKNPPKPTIDFSDEEFIEVPGVLPEPIGGLKALQEKVHYTEFARRIELEGKVYIQVKIDKNGDVVEATVLKGLGGGLDEEALNAVLSTKFIPGKQRGRPVNVKMVIPIKFVLK
jgi:protein TonB